MHARVVRKKGYVNIEASGPADLDSFLRMIKSIASLTSARSDTHMLVSLLKTEGDLNFTGHVLVGGHIAQHLSHLHRLAFVVPADKMTHMSEKVARAHGIELRVFNSEPPAVAWLLGQDDLPAANDAPQAPLMDAVSTPFWDAFRYLFPQNAQAIQLPNGNLVISWQMANDPHALFEMSTPITIRFEPELLAEMEHASVEQRKQIVLQHESAFRAGLVGYDPYALIPQARVIVLG